jgi:hypothetical protein
MSEQAKYPGLAEAEFLRFHHYEGWFCLGVTIPGIGQISYHLPEKYWHDAFFADEREWAFDGHTSDDVLKRIKQAFGIKG